MGKEVLRRFHDHGHAGLVIGPQEGRAIGGHDGLADEGSQIGVVGHADHLARIAGQDDVGSVVSSMDNGLDMAAAGLRRSIHMGDPGDGRTGARFSGAGRVGRNCRHDDAVLVLLGVFQAHGAELAGEEPAEFQLAGRTGVSRRLFIGLRIDASITAEAIEQRAHFFTPILGQMSASRHCSHSGLRAKQTWRP